MKPFGGSRDPAEPTPSGAGAPISLAPPKLALAGVAIGGDSRVAFIHDLDTFMIWTRIESPGYKLRDTLAADGWSASKRIG